jgi:hypothetical protein
MKMHQELEISINAKLLKNNMKKLRLKEVLLPFLGE